MDPDDLYGLPLDRFVAERTLLARSLRADGRRDQAGQVAALRKPSVAAWAVNQLVRTQAGSIETLFAAGDELRRAQANLIAGRGDRSALRVAGEQERAAADRLVDAARGLLTGQGHELGAAVVDRVADTLHAAALGQEAREAVRAGCLERELRHVGLGEAPLAPAVPGRPRVRTAPTKADTGLPAAKQRPPVRAQPPATGKRPRASERADRERADRERSEAQRRELERAAAGKAARAAQAEAERAGRALRAAQGRRDRAAEGLAAAEQALEAARIRAGGAEQAYRRARAELERSG